MEDRERFERRGHTIWTRHAGFAQPFYNMAWSRFFWFLHCSSAVTYRTRNYTVSWLQAMSAKELETSHSEKELSDSSGLSIPRDVEEAQDSRRDWTPEEERKLV